jgi:ankyrin repeat protein
MANVTRRLPEQPHLDVPRREARELLDRYREGNREALARIRGAHPKFRKADDAAIVAAGLKLSDAQLVLAREYTFATWAELKQRIEVNERSRALEAAIRADDRGRVIELIRETPALLHLKVRSGHWGPPMSFAANLGRLEIIQAVAELGARDYQHAFDRAVLQGRVECAAWLHAHGAKLEPGIVMGPCETFNVRGLRFLAEVQAPFTDRRGNALAPLAMLLEGYARNPAGKHACLEILRERGTELPDTPMMALHRGRLDLLREHARRDPGLLARRFSYREIYPPELGCADDGRSGLHGTPIMGGTLLHLAVDFEEAEIFDWLLAEGADVNARTTATAAGPGHTPLYNSVVGCRDARMARELLAHGADRNLRASLRKFLDWIEAPRWHEARDVTAAEWGRGFPLRDWVNAAALQAVGQG